MNSFQHLTAAVFGCLIAGMKNANFALVIAETHRPDGRHGASGPWQNYLENWQNALTSGEEKHRLTENVWLIRLDSGLLVLAGLVRRMEDYHVPVRVLFLADAPIWSQCPPATTETVSQITP
jgi:hypothetical protein